METALRSRAVDPVKKTLLRVRGVREAWAPIRERLLHSEYVGRRETYHARAVAAGVRYDESQVSRLAAERLALRGYGLKSAAWAMFTPSRSFPGSAGTLPCIPI